MTIRGFGMGFLGRNPFNKEAIEQLQEEWSRITDSEKLTNTPYICANLRSCTACGRCIAACPEQAIGKVGAFWHKHIIFINAENCIGCKKCIRVCPHGVFSENIIN